MKIGLTHARLEKSADFTNSYTLASISAWIKKVTPHVEVIFSEDLGELLKCDEIWCTATSEAWGEVNRLGKLITKHGKKFLVGGHHATALPQTLQYGVAFRGGLENYSHPDQLPLPDWSIFENNKKHMIMTSRGCPYECNFCSSRSFWRKYETKSPKRVIEEIQYLKWIGSREINIFDDLFTANKKRLREIVTLIEKHELNNIVYSCLVRSNTVDQEVIDLLKRMNVMSLAFGAESGSDRVLKLMNKNATVSNHQRAIDLLSSNDIRPTLSFIAGYPGETRGDLEQTREFIEKNRDKCDIIEIYPCIPFPGTLVWNYFVDKYDIKSLKKFNWPSLSVSIDNINWNDYYILTNKYGKNYLIELIEWNYEKNKKNNIDKQDGNNMSLSKDSIVLDADKNQNSLYCPVCRNAKNKFLSKYVDKVVISFEAAREYFPKGKTVYLGNPRASEVLHTDARKGRESVGLTNDKRSVLIVGGSQGARPINDSFLEVLPRVHEYDYQFLYVTGQIHYDKVMREVEKIGNPSNVIIKPFIHNMPEVLSGVDLIVARAGATTLAEITALGLPSILIPSPYVTNNHQEKNARSLSDAGAAILRLEKEMSGELLLKDISTILSSEVNLNDMKKASKKIGMPNAATDFYHLLLELKNS